MGTFGNAIHQKIFGSNDTLKLHTSREFFATQTPNTQKRYKIVLQSRKTQARAPLQPVLTLSKIEKYKYLSFNN